MVYDIPNQLNIMRRNMSSAETIIGRIDIGASGRTAAAATTTATSTTATTVAMMNDYTSEVKPRTIEVTPEALIGMVQIVDKNSATMFNLIEKLTDLSLATQKETVIMKEQFRKSEKKRSLLQK